ncbi:MAG: Gfo/Idh/MocA family oxidoreductase [Planctomycetota bacterium]
MTQVGIIGVGFMGMVHYLTYQKLANVKVAALCDSVPSRLAGDWTDIKGNFGPAGTQMDLSGVATYENVDDMLADENLDVIDICLPPSAHADVAVKALNAGKHVFSEKPMALTIEDTERMVATSQSTGKLLMVGHVLPTFPEFDFAIRTARSGEYGKLLGGHFRRVISDPSWLPHFYDPNRVGGPMLDLHIHDAHFIRYMFGKPNAVTSQGRMRGEVVEYFNSQFNYDEGYTVSATSGVIRQQSRAFLHGYEIHLEQATLAFEFAVIDDQPTVAMPCTVFPAEGKSFQPELGSGDPMDAFEIELTHVVQGIESGEPAEFLQAGLAQDAIRICQQQTESVKSGQTVSI